MNGNRETAANRQKLIVLAVVAGGLLGVFAYIFQFFPRW